jgi:hypothetical protein
VADGVDRLPGDDHRHHRGLAGAGGELQGEPGQPRIGEVVGAHEIVAVAAALGAHLGSDLRQPDDRLHGLDLAEEGADVLEVVMPPVLEQAGGRRRHAPLALGQLPPALDALADVVDDGLGVVLLRLGGAGLALVEDDLLLGLGLALLGFGNRGEELGGAAPFDDAVGGLAVGVQLPVPRGVRVGRVEDGGREEVGRQGNDALGTVARRLVPTAVLPRAGL